MKFIMNYKLLKSEDIDIEKDEKLSEKDLIATHGEYICIYNLSIMKNEKGDIYYYFKDIEGTSINNLSYEDIKYLNYQVPMSKNINKFLYINENNYIPIDIGI